MSDKSDADTIAVLRNDVRELSKQLRDTQKDVSLKKQQNKLAHQQIDELEAKLRETLIGILPIWPAAIQYILKIAREALLDPVDNVPFRREAGLFAEFYWANKEKYAEAMVRNK